MIRYSCCFFHSKIIWQSYFPKEPASTRRRSEWNKDLDIWYGWYGWFDNIFLSIIQFNAKLLFNYITRKFINLTLNVVWKNKMKDKQIGVNCFNRFLTGPANPIPLENLLNFNS